MNRLAGELYAETERIQAVMSLTNDIAMAARAYNEGKTEIAGHMRQQILDVMHENETDYITQAQLFRLFN